MQQASSTSFQLQTVQTTHKRVDWRVTNLFHIVTTRNGVHSCATCQFHFVSFANIRNHAKRCPFACNTLFHLNSARNCVKLAQQCPFACNKLVSLCFSSKQWEPCVTVSIRMQHAFSALFQLHTMRNTRKGVHLHVTWQFNFVSEKNVITTANGLRSNATSFLHIVSAPNSANHA